MNRWVFEFKNGENKSIGTSDQKSVVDIQLTDDQAEGALAALQMRAFDTQNGIRFKAKKFNTSNEITDTYPVEDGFLDSTINQVDKIGSGKLDQYYQEMLDREINHIKGLRPNFKTERFNIIVSPNDLESAGMYTSKTLQWFSGYQMGLDWAKKYGVSNNPAASASSDIVAVSADGKILPIGTVSYLAKMVTPVNPPTEVKPSFTPIVVPTSQSQSLQPKVPSPVPMASIVSQSSITPPGPEMKIALYELVKSPGTGNETLFDEKKDYIFTDIDHGLVLTSLQGGPQITIGEDSRLVLYPSNKEPIGSNGMEDLIRRSFWFNIRKGTTYFTTSNLSIPTFFPPFPFLKPIDAKIKREAEKRQYTFTDKTIIQEEGDSLTPLEMIGYFPNVKFVIRGVGTGVRRVPILEFIFDREGNEGIIYAKKLLYYMGLRHLNLSVYDVINLLFLIVERPRPLAHTPEIIDYIGQYASKNGKIGMMRWLNTMSDATYVPGTEPKKFGLSIGGFSLPEYIHMFITSSFAEYGQLLSISNRRLASNVWNPDYMVKPIDFIRCGYYLVSHQTRDEISRQSFYGLSTGFPPDFVPFIDQLGPFMAELSQSCVDHEITNFTEELASASASLSKASRSEMLTLDSILDGVVSNLGIIFPPRVNQLGKFQYFFTNLKHYFLSISRASGLVPLEDYVEETGEAVNGTIIKDVHRTASNDWNQNAKMENVFFDLWKEMEADMSVLDDLTEDVRRKIRSYSGKTDVDFPDIKDYPYSKEFVYVSEMTDTELIGFLAGKGVNDPSYSNRIELVFKALGYLVVGITS